MRREKILIILIILLGLVLRLINLNQSFWLDEAAQVIESARPLSQQFDLSADFHPPLFHLLLHFWMKAGKSEAWVRLLSVLFALGSILFTYLIGNVAKKANVGLTAALLLALSPYHIWYSQEARPYMLFVFLSVSSTYYLLRKKWGIYTLILTMCLYSSYFAPFLILSHLFLVFFLNKKIKKYLSCLFFSVLAFLPWVPFFINQLEVGLGEGLPGWKNIVSFPTVKLVPLTFAKFIYGRGSIDNNYIYFLVIFPVLALFFLSLIKLFITREGKMFLFLFFFPLASVAVCNLFIPVAAPQRLIFILPLFYLILSLGQETWRKEPKIIALLSILIISGAGIRDYYFNPYVQREKWRQAVNYVEKNSDPASVALFIFPEPFAPYKWYSRNKIEAWAIAPLFLLRDQDLINLSKKLNDKKKIFLFQYLTGLTDKDKKIFRFLKEEGYGEVKVTDFPGVGFVYEYEKYSFQCQ